MKICNQCCILHVFCVDLIMLAYERMCILVAQIKFFCSDNINSITLCVLSCGTMGKRAAPVAGKLPADLVKRFKSCITSHETNDPALKELHDRYKAANFEEKKEILDRFEKDTKMKFVSQYLKERVESKESTEETAGEWLTEKQIADKENLDINDDADQAELKIILEGFESRKHVNAKLASLGRMQYKYITHASSTVTKSSENFVWTEAACGKEAAEKKAVPAAGESGPNLTINYEVACQKVVGQIASCKKTWEKQEVLYTRLKNHKDVEADTKTAMKTAFSNVEAVWPTVEDARDNHTKDETGHTMLKEAMRVFGERVDAFIAENNKHKDLLSKKNNASQK